jgi:gliding motility-associated-like protein
VLSKGGKPECPNFINHRNAGLKQKAVKISLTCIFMLLAWADAFATHNRAGEITYRQIGKLTYEATLISYTDTRSKNADRPTIDLKWGDGTTASITRKPADQITLPNFIWKNIYKSQHTFAGPGQYIISFEDPNRVAGIENMTNSVGTEFYVESLLIIDPQRGFDQSPVLLNPPIDNACINKVFTHNPNAYDPDGDSLYFSLIPPKQAQNTDVNGYSTPPGFLLDNHTGQITWTVPRKIGIYNVAILIEEFRSKKRIGYIIRDMQINVISCDSNPPVIVPMRDTCIEAGQNFNFIEQVRATDPDKGDSILLYASGGPFLQAVSPAVMITNPGRGKDAVNALFEWKVDCGHIRKQPYLVVFRAVDQTNLIDIKNMQIRVVGPEPKNLKVKPFGNTVALKWDKPDCPNPVGYLIYRRNDSSLWKHATCEIGVPGYVGYKLIDTVISANVLSYVDDNHGSELSPGIRYCYVVTALYRNAGQFENVEGYASNEACAELKKDVPVLTHASVRVTSATNGSMYVDWSKPLAKSLDTNQNSGPYMYKLYRSPGGATSNFTLINTSASASFSGLNDTTYIDTLLNTVANGYTYKVEFYNTNSLTGKLQLLGKTISASSVFLKAGRAFRSIVLTWDVKVPWENSYYEVFRKNNLTQQWDSIGRANATLTYKDTGLINGKDYCYYIRSHGSYRTPGFTDPILNLSQTICASPRDTVKPCAPVITDNAKADCDTRTTQLEWTLTDSCTTKTNRIKIYFSPGNSNKYVVIDSINNKTARSYLDNRLILQHSLAGCYYITVVDSYDNESLHSNYLCVDNCPRYDLPNIITPNGDHINDLFEPMPGYRFVESIDLKVYNRWGQEVFATTDPAINWDGTDEKSHIALADGVYYYYCIVKEIYFDGIHERAIEHTLSILRK